ncbi:phospholipase D family protein [Alkalicoccobacillus gibsonii]|uniref:Phospholipase D family protein n=1 Tax=Alkalicoccobacillus gibsonii TaxID=79881 RepID=A0ABU9VM24_9BACI
MITIDNIHTTHYSALRDLINNGDSLLIASPYLMRDMDDIFNNIFAGNIKEIHLITTMKDDDLDLLKKADSIHSLLVNCLKHNIECNIRVNNKLHGKVYLAIENDQVKQGIVTSANFTNSGLLRNHEWGINHSDLNQLAEIKNNLMTHASEILSEAELISIIEKIDENKERIEYLTDRSFQLKINDLINKEEKLNKDLSKKRFFLKPVGWSENHYSINERMPEGIAKLHFSKRKPAAVREGDVLICYAVGTAKLLGYFEAIERPYHLGHEGR